MGQSYIFRSQVRDKLASNGSRTHTIFVQNCSITHVTYNNNATKEKMLKALEVMHHCVFKIISQLRLTENHLM